MLKGIVKLNPKKTHYQLWINGGVNSSFDAEIFTKQQVIKFGEKLLKEGSEGVNIQVEDQTGEPFYVCAECGSKNVELKLWVNQNTGALSSPFDCDKNDHWCNDCQEHHSIEVKA